MRVIINGRFLSKRTTGVQRYGREIIRAMDRLLPGYDAKIYVEIVHPSVDLSDAPRLNNIALKPVGWLRGHAWEQFELPIYARGMPLLNLCGSAPVAHRTSLSVVHDCTIYAAPQAFTIPALAWYRLMQPQIARGAKVLGTVSRFSASELERYYGIERERIEILPNGADHLGGVNPDMSCLARYGLVPGSYLATVVSRQPNKNIGQLIRVSDNVMDKFGLKTVLVGGEGRGLARDRRMTTPSSVVTTGYLDDEQMCAIVKAALCFVFPSRYEGFGIPPVEAMSLGTPVITTAAASLPEVCGDAALYFGVDDDDGLLKSIGRLYRESELRKELRLKGQEQVKRYSWEHTARRILDILTSKF